VPPLAPLFAADPAGVGDAALPEQQRLLVLARTASALLVNAVLGTVLLAVVVAASRARVRVRGPVKQFRAGVAALFTMHATTYGVNSHSFAMRLLLTAGSSEGVPPRGPAATSFEAVAAVAVLCSWGCVAAVVITVVQGRH
jgi:hypothetical protein